MTVHQFAAATRIRFNEAELFRAQDRVRALLASGAPLAAVSEAAARKEAIENAIAADRKI